MEENIMKNTFKKVNNFVYRKTLSVKKAISNNSGEGYIDTAVKILISVVLGALLLAGLYALFGDVVMPTLKERIQEMFNYAG
jgi:hypothetical protein